MNKLILLACLVVSLPLSAWSAVDPMDLRIAIENDRSSEIGKYLASKEITPDTRVMSPGFGGVGIPMIGLSALAGSEGVTRLLIEAGADLNARNEVDETPLMLAAFFPDGLTGDVSQYAVHERVVRLLVEHGAKLENIPGAFSPLSYASYYGHFRILKYLLDQGALPDGDAKDGVSNTMTALMFSAENGHKDQVWLLLERGADPRIKNSHGHDPVFFAKDHNENAIVDILLCALSLQPGEKLDQKCPH